MKKHGSKKRKFNKIEVIDNKVRLYLSGQKHQGLFVTLDLEDLPLVEKYLWLPLKHGYTFYASAVDYNSKRTPKRRFIRMHRIIMSATIGQIVDHVDGNGLNNTKQNLRICSQSENVRNRSPWKTKSFKYKGVWERFNDTGTTYYSKIVCNGRRFYLGTFTTPEEAAIAYNNKALELFGQFAKLNKIEK